MQILGIHHLALKVVNVEGVTAFYRDVLGLAEQQRHFRPDGSLRSIWLTVPGAGFLAVESHEHDTKPDPSAELPGWYLPAFTVAVQERRRIEAELEQRGVDIVHRTKWTLYFRDPEGNRVGLSHHPHDA